MQGLSAGVVNVSVTESVVKSANPKPATGKGGPVIHEIQKGSHRQIRNYTKHNIMQAKCNLWIATK